MRFHRTLTRPLMAATMLAGMVLPTPQAARASTPHAVPEVRPVVHEAETPKPVRLVRQTTSKRYTVKRGDCLWNIARRELGSGFSWPRIYEANRGQIADPDLIFPGQVFVLPGGASRHAHGSWRRKVAQKKHAHRVATRERLSDHGSGLHASGAHRQARRPEHTDELAITLEPVRPRTAARPPLAPAPGYESQTIVLGDDPQPAQSTDQFQGHRRVNGHFYVMREGTLVWADDGTPVRGAFSERLSEQVYPSRQAMPTLAAIQPPPQPASELAAEESTIQGHRRINGTFFARKGGQLVWADTGEPVHAGSRPAQTLAP